MTRFTKALVFLVVLPLVGCQSAYYGALEKVGIHKRDVLVSRIEKSRDAQQEAKQQFASALEQFKSVVQFDGGDLERVYEQLNTEYEDSEQAAANIKSRIEDVESVAEALFEEWEEELTQYTSASLKRKSAEQLRQTKSRYQSMLKTMKSAERTMYPVLNVFKDQVLFLKHNLNAQAIASIKNEIRSIESNVTQLIAQMNRSIDKANQFIQSMEQ